MKTVLTLAVAALCVGTCESAYSQSRSAAEILRPKPVRVPYAGRVVRVAHLNYPRPGEFRSFGIVETPNYAVIQPGLPMIGSYEPTYEVAPVVVPLEAHPFIGSTPNPPLGPQGTNRAVINQITGLPVDR